METTRSIFAFIREYLAMHPWSPSLQEIADACGLSHASSVIRHLDRLQGWDLIEREPGVARSIVVTKKGETADI